MQQRDQAQRVVLHLRSLIHGQAHHMEHIVRSIGTTPELESYAKQGYSDADTETDVSTSGSLAARESQSTRATTPATPIDGQDVTPSMESQLLAANRRAKRFSDLSMVDVADRHLRDKTDAIADIIRNISEQCAAAVEGLQLAQEAAEIERSEEDSTEDDSRNSKASPEGDRPTSATPHSERDSIPPTPELVHQRSSTALSMASTAPTNYTSRESIAPSAGRARIVTEEHIDRVYGGSPSLNGEIAEPSKKHVPEQTRRFAPIGRIVQA